MSKSVCIIMSMIALISLPLSINGAWGDVAKWKLRIKVVDLDGNPVEGVRVSNNRSKDDEKAYEMIKANPGFFLGYTDDKGIAHVEGAVTSSIWMFTRKEGYYLSELRYTFDRKRLGKWMPWDEVVEIVIKDIRNPEPMYGKGVSLLIPKQDNTPVGFDFEKGDWVKPYGRGEHTDFIVRVSKEVKDIDEGSSESYENISIEFPNEGDGLLRYDVPQPDISRLRLPHEAPLQGYENFLRKSYSNKGGRSDYRLPSEEINYFFRVRTVKDVQGNIIEACYGKIFGEIDLATNFSHSAIKFYYVFNPRKSRNLEWDTRENLFSEGELKENLSRDFRPRP